ncbi:MAG: hypothetical protein R2793_00915 [Flavobacteriaceae bacterium]
MELSKKKHIFVLVPDGVGIKNYLYTRLFQGGEFSITIFHNFDTETLAYLKKQIPFEKEVTIPAYKERFLEKFLRELIHLARLRHNAKTERNPTILKFWNKAPKSLKLQFFYFLVTTAARVIPSYASIEKLEKQYQKALPRNPFYRKVKELLALHQPDALFCTHQRALKAPTIFAAAASLHIPSSTVIYSWDNLPKARLALRANRYLVWSAFMKNEMERFYPEIPKEDIMITGTPQFEFYFDPKYLIPKEVFYTTYQLDPSKKILCFSGDDIRTSPNDPMYLDDIASAIEGSSLKEEVQILLRRCPVDLSGRFDWVVKKYPNLIKEAPPLWNFNTQKWTAVYPTKEDVALLVSTAYYAFAVMNVGSTMAFDFGMFDKPCIFINYDVKENKQWSAQTIYKYQHFRSMPSSKAVYWFNDKGSIAYTLQEALAMPKTGIREWFHIVVNHPENASEHIAKVIT